MVTTDSLLEQYGASGRVDSPSQSGSLDLRYGFGNVYSNVPLPRLSQLWQLVEEADCEQPFLQTGVNYLVVDLNHSYLTSMVEQLVAEALQEYVPYSLAEGFVAEQQFGRSYPHHTTQTVMHFYRPRHTNGDQPDIAVVYGRVKQRDSLTEKITRLFAQKKQVDSRVLNEFLGRKSHHLDVEDSYGVTLVCRDESTLYDVQRRLLVAPFLATIGPSKDYVREPKPSGYRAVHDKFVVTDGQGNVRGLLLEVHLETVSDHPHNHQPNGQIGRDHGTYSLKKLQESPHQQGDNQIIIFEKNGHDHQLVVPVNVSNRFVQYTLFNY